MTRSKGSFPPAPVSEILEQTLSKSLADANLQDHALGVGIPQDGEKVGKHNAVWCEVKLLAATDLNNVEVPHTLRQIPVTCALDSWSNAETPDVYFAARPVLPERWSKTTCRMAVVKTGGAGAVTGSVLRFRVGGA